MHRNRNPILDTDSYKLSHFLQYPPGTTEVSAYIEARAGARFRAVTFFGLQMFLKQKLMLQPIVPSDVYDAEAFATAHIPGLEFNRQGWLTMVDEFKGRYPIEIQALPEGITVPVGTPLVQVRNTDPRFPWLTTYIETALLRAIWYPSTVATLSREAKKIIYDALQKTSEDPDGQIGFKLHDFGSRGCTSQEQAGLGGCAHLVNFMGSDTIEGVLYAQRYYDADRMPAFSIPAAEHSTITAWGASNEGAAYKNMLEQFGGTGRLVAVVSDSYDIKHAVRHLWCDQLKTDVVNMGGTLVVRPDSGDPVETPLWVLRELANAFGTTRNAKGYAVLNSAVRVIQGDGMTIETIRTLMRAVVDAGFSVDNIAMGMGGGLLQKLDRDTMRFAMKANEVVINGQANNVFKSPVGDITKQSKAGRLGVVDLGGEITTTTERLAGADNLLRTVWKDGKLLRHQTIDEVRERAKL